MRTDSKMRAEGPGALEMGGPGPARLLSQT